MQVRWGTFRTKFLSADEDLYPGAPGNKKPRCAGAGGA